MAVCTLPLSLPLSSSLLLLLSLLSLSLSLWLVPFGLPVSPASGSVSRRHKRQRTCVQIQTWMSTHGRSVAILDASEEQPTQNAALFNDYAHMIAQQLEGFIRSEGVDEDTLVAVLHASQQGGQLGALCVDYILASIDYERFVSLVADFGDIYGWHGDSDAAGGDDDDDDKADSEAARKLEESDEKSVA